MNTPHKVRISVNRKATGDSTPDPAPEEALPSQQGQKEGAGAAPSPEQSAEGVPGEKGAEDLEWWRDRALRLQAEMENFRKRQQRLAEERMRGDQERLLRAFLKVADDLERALQSSETDPRGLREGILITYQSLMNLLATEGVQRIEAKGQTFDPNLHEAVTAVEGAGGDSREPQVLEVLEPGYVLGDRLLRPAKVVVSR
ncbi:MAG: nucleotide exchange factor GrpE [Anaerolineae bacterium]